MLKKTWQEQQARVWNAIKSNTFISDERKATAAFDNYHAQAMKHSNRKVKE